MNANNDALLQPTLQPQHLPSVAEKRLSAKCKPGLFSYCPTMDLVALATEDEQVHVFRLNGQQVLGADLAGDPYLDEVKGEVRGIGWKHDGQLLAVADAENKLRVISSYSGKTVHHYPCHSSNDSGSNTSARVSCIGWGVNFTDIKSAKSYLQDANGQLTAEDLLVPDTDPVKTAMLLKADLPRELALLDVESSLPKLATLPGNGNDEDVFSNRASIDSIFHSPHKSSSDSVDVLFVGFTDGNAHLRIFNCFEIGNFSLLAASSNTSGAETLAHASHPMSSTHSVLLSESAQDGARSSLKLVTLDLRFIVKCGRYLSLLASKTTQLQNLLRYISQTQRQIVTEWKNISELPARFIQSIADDLQEKCHCDFVTALYHLVVTGNCFPPVKEFLIDIVGERGHKRWEKTVSSGYENVRRLIHECLLPALERCEVLLSRLIGISKFHKLNHILGLETRDLQDIVETADCLHLLSHTMLAKTSSELRQFVEFAKWLRHEIDIQTAEPMSQTLGELLEKSDMIDHATTLEYIEGALTKSALRLFISSSALPSVLGTSKKLGGADQKGQKQGSFYEAYRHELAALQKEQDNVQPEKAESTQEDKIPKLNNLIDRLSSQSDKVFEQIALTQKRSILNHSLLELHPDCDRDVVDTTMRYEVVDDQELFCVYVAARLKKAPHTLLLYRAALVITNGVSSSRDISLASLRLPEGEIKQVQFVQDGTIAILHTDNANRSCLVTFHVTRPNLDDTDPTPFYPQYQPYKPSYNNLSPLPTPLQLDLAGDHSDLVLHAFPFSGSKSRPIRLSVNGRKGRRAVCVLYADHIHYEVLDIDSEVQEEEEEEMATD
ncbi:putative anaphase-promoting complex component Cut20/Apc4 [Talaromyces proteolyticus]|uniref:Anaphase-promoting complex subunit 4 n=1 Tax=Talaromyces proteolyticus TaxID=1131652 RepID=A0AAD4KTM4_9EURO|nr:putative anaphase-promoting complex component Cut20/Apc4 [Talaromyces proteolyticus]KAH8699046.1 putative anaphase-promoting complex component Cut20/Apc4 [Talaromyces proteolyticus]